MIRWRGASFFVKITILMIKFKTFIYAVSVLSGTIIGVGLFSLPYITAKVGFWVMAGYFLVLGFLVILVHLFFGEVALKTPNFKRFPGFAEIHLGDWGRNVAFISTILGLMGAILAYLIVGGEFLKEILSPVFGGNANLYTIIYFIAGTAIIYWGIMAITKVEFWGLILFFVLLIAIFFRGQNFINNVNLFPAPDFFYLFLPYGAIIFSLWGAPLIPEIEEMLGVENKKALRTIIFVSILISIIIYLFFIYLILGITGPMTTESALAGLKNYLGNGVVILTLIFGVITTFTSFLTLGLTLKKVLWYDLKIGENTAWAITCFTPMVLFLAGIKSFIAVIGVVGGVMLAVDGILILLMYQKINPKRKTLVYPLIIAFLGGIIYSFIYFT